MEFKQILDMNMVPEWRNQYLDYGGLDTALNKAIERKSLGSRRKGVNMYFELIKSNQKFANYFSRECQSQLDKINSFHKERLNEMQGKYKNLQDQLEQVLSSAVYKEIQPEISNLHTDDDEMDNNSNASISSITELFRSIRQRLNSISISSERNSPIPTLSPVGGELYVPNSACSSSHRDSISPNTVLDMPHITAANLHPASNRNLRLSNVARKFSEGFNLSIRKFSTNLDNNNPLARLNQRHKNSLSRILNDWPAGNGDSNLASNGSERSVGASTMLTTTGNQSKRKIVASYRKKIRQLKFAFREFYVMLVLFEQYTQLNHTGFEQILRKHDRMFASTLGRKFYQENVQTADFYINLEDIDQLIEGVEHIYTLHFARGNRRQAIEKLQVPPNFYKKHSPQLDFRVGCELGMFMILFAVVMVVGLTTDTDYDWRTVFRLFRSPLIVIIFLFQAGISIIIWKHYKINHVLIFELDPRHNLSFHHFLELGSLLGIVWSIAILLFLNSEHLNVPPAVWPLLVIILMACFLFNPTATCHHRSRFWLIKILIRIFSAPLFPVRLPDFWVADQLVSIVPLFLDLEYLSCFYTSESAFEISRLNTYHASRCVTRKPQDLVVRTIFAALPAWFRCAQCLRRWRDENWLRLHLANAGKYGCMVMVVVLSSISQYNKSSFELDTMRIIWMTAAIFTSSLTAYWDIIYDFGLFSTYDTDDSKSDARERSLSIGSTDTTFEIFLRTSKRKNTYPFLRKELLYPVWVYYFAIVENVILRFGWIISISLTEFSGIETGIVISILAPLEMFRRFVWNCIRLENEQLNNCGLFRATRDIPIEVVAPIDDSHLDKVIMMMDSRDGPSMRNRLMKRRTLGPDRLSIMVLEPNNSPGSTVNNERANIRM